MCRRQHPLHAVRIFSEVFDTYFCFLERVGELWTFLVARSTFSWSMTTYVDKVVFLQSHFCTLAFLSPRDFLDAPCILRCIDICFWLQEHIKYDNNIRLLKTDKLQLQTLKWYMQVLYKHNTDIKSKEKTTTSVTVCKEHSN